MAKKTEQQKSLDKLKDEIKAIQAEADRYIATQGVSPRELDEKRAGLLAGIAHLQAQAE